MFYQPIVTSALLLAVGAHAAVHNSSYNWAGGIVELPGKIIEASVQVVVPECTDSNFNSIAGMSGWVGIDGYGACDGALLQTGFGCSIINGDGKQNLSYNVWTEWYPATSVTYDNFDVKAGDLLSLSVSAKSKTSGSTSIYNHRTGQRKQTQYTDQPSLCLDYAEWIVESEFFEDHGIDGGELTANFTPVDFSQVSYLTSDHKTGTVAVDDLFNMVQNDNTTVAESCYKSEGNFVVRFTQPASWHPWE
ncbi:hypothetical protein NLU13_5875 [Sarocladium strictum]|uniref:Concanavalin A-like lectin/glucanase n=1 Tax=Sarocladium strictum TaxID=5046 RepID=A0AA39GG48_SARSR|nr:hypothetical protein NLU13_5875 [Sarocladium strictum]